MRGKKFFTLLQLSGFFENPDLAGEILSDLHSLEVSRILLQPSCIVQDDDFQDCKENGITYVVYDKKGWHYARRRLSAQGMFARMFFDPFGKKRVEKAIVKIKEYYKNQPVIIEITERI